MHFLYIFVCFNALRKTYIEFVVTAVQSNDSNTINKPAAWRKGNQNKHQWALTQMQYGLFFFELYPHQVGKNLQMK